MHEAKYGAKGLKAARRFFRPRMSLKKWARMLADGGLADSDQARYAASAQGWLERKRKAG